MGTANQMIEPGNVSIASPYYISGLTLATLTGVAAGAPVFTLVNLGRKKLQPDPADPLINVPIYVSQVRLKFPLAAAGTAAFTVSKVTVTAQRTTGTGATQKLATLRKSTGYPPIPATEINAWCAGSDATGGGTIVVQGDPFDMTDGTFGTFWTPADLCPIILEQGEGIEVRSAVAMTATGPLLSVVDFLRQ